MKTRLFFLSLAYFSLLVFGGCRCEEIEFPYYDFTAMEFYYSQGTEVGVDTDFAFTINDTEREFLATNSSFDLGLLSKAYATQPCPGNGEYGRKFVLVNVEITSNADYDNTHPAGTSLRDLFLASRYNYRTEAYEMVPVAELDQNNLYELVLQERPSLSAEHIFTVTVTKDNNETVTASTAVIKWM